MVGPETDDDTCTLRGSSSYRADGVQQEIYLRGKRASPLIGYETYVRKALYEPYTGEKTRKLGGERFAQVQRTP